MYTTTNLLEEYLLDYSLFEAQNTMLDDMMRYEDAMITESAGIIYINEGIAETLKNFFTKIVNAIKQAFEKLQAKIIGLSQETLKKSEDEIRKGPEPDFQVKMYHEYDFDKLTNQYDANKILSLIGANMEAQEVKLMSREDIAREAFGNDLFDPKDGNKLKPTDMVRKICTTNTITDTTCTRNMLDTCLDFCLDGYKKCLDKLKSEKEGLEKQENTINQYVDGIQRVEQAKEISSESYYFYEAEVIKKPDDDKTDDKTSFESNKSEEERKGKDRNTVLTKNLMNYIGLFADLFSAKLKVLNKAYIDYFNLISFYCRESKIRLHRPKKKEEPKAL